MTSMLLGVRQGAVIGCVTHQEEDFRNISTLNGVVVVSRFRVENVHAGGFFLHNALQLPNREWTEAHALWSNGKSELCVQRADGPSSGSPCIHRDSVFPFADKILLLVVL